MGALDNLREQRRLGGGVTDSLTPTPDAGASNEPKEPSLLDRAKEPFFGSSFFSPISGEIKTAKSFPSSAWHAAKDIGHAVTHLGETAENFENLGKGLMQETGLLSGTEYENYPEAVGRQYAQRYGSLQAAREAFETDPVGVLLDMSVVFGGAGAAAKLPSVASKIGKVGETIADAGSAISPLKAAGALAKEGIAKPAGKVASEVVGAIGTGTGGESLRLAYGAGKEGGEAQRSLLSQMRKTAPTTEAVDDARAAVENMRKQRGGAYVDAMKKIKSNKTALKFDDVDAAMSEIGRMVNFRGVPRPRLSKTAEDIDDQVHAFKAMTATDPKFATVEAFDRLKQHIGDIRAGTEYGTPERKMADVAYNAVRGTITKQAPEYAKIMGAYEEASDLIKQMEKTLSINPNAQIDTTLRKLQKVLRDDVNTQYGHSRELAQYLVNAGAPNLLHKIAGQALDTWSPRGFGRATAGIEAVGAAALGGLSGLGHVAPMMALSSPRLMGEAAHGLGVAARKAGTVPFTSYKWPTEAIGQGAYQAGHLDEVETDALTDQVEKALH